MGYRCVVIDDSRLMRRFMSALLEGAGAEVMALRTAEEGIAACEQMRPNLVLLDLKLPDNDGVNLLPVIKRGTCAGSDRKLGAPRSAHGGNRVHVRCR